MQIPPLSKYENENYFWCRPSRFHDISQIKINFPASILTCKNSVLNCSCQRIQCEIHNLNILKLVFERDLKASYSPNQYTIRLYSKISVFFQYYINLVDKKLNISIIDVEKCLVLINVE